jgi:beta-lactam-binding protein with PASTA domain
MLWLRFYTNHGQKLELPDYEDTFIVDAIKDADKRSFQIIVNDSVHMVGRRGGMIINQNPKKGALVKENRKIYVTITKFNPDKITLADLPVLYGSDFDQKRKELSYQEINSVIDGFKYDPGEPNHILEVRYNDEVIVGANIERKDVEIEKGGTLHFILSEQSGGTTKIPDLRCMTVAQARFYLEGLKLRLGNITPQGVENMDDAYIVNQLPAYDPVAIIDMGSPIDIMVSENIPEDCN